jgi:pimeloyl-ACP methyl ester carboxylesterase
VDRVPIRYARSGDVNVAYQVTGDGPIDLVLVHGFFSHLEVDWEHPASRRIIERLSSFSRLIRFDKRGTGLSDRSVGMPDFEARMDDMRAVMDAAGSERAVLLGYSEGGPMCVLFAATYPARAQALVLYGTHVRRRSSCTGRTPSACGPMITPGRRPGKSESPPPNTSKSIGAKSSISGKWRRMLRPISSTGPASEDALPSARAARTT